MFVRITKLQTRFFICYLLAIFIPILLLSSIIYYYHSNQRTREYLSEKENSLIVEQNYLNNQLESSRNYYNQLKSNYELLKLLKGFYPTEREIVYAYNSQLYALITGIFHYDQNLRGISIYSDNRKASEILRFFEPLSDLPLSDNSSPALIDGFWTADEETGDPSFSFYIGFTTAPMSAFPGIARLNYNSNIFDAYARENPDSAVYIYLNEKLLYQYNSTPAATRYLERYRDYLLPEKNGAATRIIPDADSRLVTSSMELENGVFWVIKITPEEETIFSYRPFLLSLLVTVLVMVSASILMFLLILRPFQNIVRLSEHMNSQRNHTLTLYEGLVTKDETGDLICAFNQMAERINDLSSSLLNSEIQLKNAQIEALQSQLNPHFFYGTLESIRMIAEADRQELIADIAFSFGNLMRYSLSREYLAPVSRELDMTRQYVSIQEKRLVNRFDISWETCAVDEKWRCPKFVLFSMVENVFSHNVSKCRSFIHVTVRIQEENDDLTFVVTNTGPGVPGERLKELQYLLEHPQERGSLKSENNGRSIFNISDRLKLFYGEGYRFTIESTENALTTCTVRIHKHFIHFLE